MMGRDKKSWVDGQLRWTRNSRGVFVCRDRTSGIAIFEDGTEVTIATDLKSPLVWTVWTPFAGPSPRPVISDNYSGRPTTTILAGRRSS